jgi:Mrp family chromosome partitioning ATPase
MQEDGLYAEEDVEDRLGLACLALIPLVGLSFGEEAAGPVELVLTEPFSALAETFRVLKAGLLAGGSGPPLTVAVASALPEEGKTTTCMCLGRILARAGSPTVVVDCDLRRQAMSRLLAAPPKIGLLDVLSGKAALEDALIEDEASGLWLLPIGDEGGGEDIRPLAHMDELLQTLSRRFSVVILDTAPVLLVAETTELASKADAVLFLARWGRTPASAAANAVKRLKNAGAHMAGAALTQVNLRRVGGGYVDAADYYPFYDAKTNGRSAFLPRPDRPAPQ